MASFKCPQCGNTVTAETAQGLVCPTCGYGRTPSWQAQPGGAFTASAPGPGPGQGMEMPPGAAPPGPPPMGTGPVCPRCQSTYTKPGGIPTWAVVCAVALFFFLCFFSLLFLLAKDDHICYNCGLHWR